MYVTHFSPSIHGVGAAKASAHIEQGGAMPTVVIQPSRQTTAIKGNRMEGAQHAVQQAAPASGPLTLCWIYIDIKNKDSAMAK